MNFATIEGILAEAHADGRTGLFEHECYALLAESGAEAAPANRLIPPGSQPTTRDLEAVGGTKVVLKVVSPDITHKTEAKGVRIVANEPGAVEAAHELMTTQAPATYARWLEDHGHEMPEALTSLSGGTLEARLRERSRGVLLCRFMESDAQGFATELFVGIRATAEFGPIISAGLGGVEMEVLARNTRQGAAVAIAPTGLVDGARFLELFRGTLSYERLSGAMRGGRKLVDDAVLQECFQAFIDIANHFSADNPAARFWINELEVNPFAISGGHIAPLDGVCSFQPAGEAPEERPLHKVGSLLRPQSAAVIGVSSKGMNMGRIILHNMLGGGFPKENAFIIRPGLDELDGVRCVSSLAELPHKVDLLVVAVGADQVPAVLTDLLDHDASNAVILIPGGLGEKEGSQELASQLKTRIREAHRTDDGGPVFIGGNSLGVISHPGRYDTMFIPETKLPKSRGDHTRRTCFISQSGAFIIANLSRMPWLDPAFALSIGNQIDLTVSDLLRSIRDEPEIDVFAVYMEGFQEGDGLAFARAVEETVAAGKDVVFYKAGRTSEGRSATAGHTASVAGDYAVCAAALEQAGAFVAHDFNEFSDLLRLCVRLKGKKAVGERVVALSNAGFEAVGMADSIRGEHRALELVRFSDDAAADLQGILTEFRLDGLVDVKNPFDITPMANDEAYTRLVETILGDDAVDVAVVGIVPLTPALQTLAEGDGHRESVTAAESICQRLPDVAAASTKPVVVVVDSGELFDPMAEALEARGLPVFRAADRAMRVLRRWLDVKVRRA
jgi:acyl-CoA synthetase (NDP forming)